MPRANTPHDRQSLVDLAERFTHFGEEIRRVADRIKSEKLEAIIAKNPELFRVAHQASVDAGLDAARKLVREADAKLDDLVASNR